MNISDLATPSLLIDNDRLMSNLDAMQKKADANHVRLRPHTKTHKSINLARLQTAKGAGALAVAKLGEAEVFAAAGFDDIRLAYILIGDDKYERVVKLLETIRISFCIDTMEGARGASDFFNARGLKADVLIEVDCGYGRCGVPWNLESSVDFAREAVQLPGLNIVGILTHAGDAYKGPSGPDETAADALRAASNRERDRMIEFANTLFTAGLIKSKQDFEISIGSTPSMVYFENVERNGFTVTEIRPGNYVFNDAVQVGIEVCSWANCALTVYATVISKRRDSNGAERLYLDAGRKVFTSDLATGIPGYGVMLYNPRTMEPLPHAEIVGLSEEHGWVKVKGGATLNVGDTVRVVPNHACVVVNTQHSMYVVDGDDVVGTWPVDAQSLVQ